MLHTNPVVTHTPRAHESARTRARALDGAGAAPCARVCVRIVCRSARTVSHAAAAAAAIWAGYAGAYLLGASNTDDCPSGSSKIGTEAACESAAVTVGVK